MPFIGGHIWLVLILLVIVLIVMGPGKLPDVGHGLGRAIRDFRHSSRDLAAAPSDAAKPPAIPAADQVHPPAPPPLPHA